MQPLIVNEHIHLRKLSMNDAEAIFSCIDTEKDYLKEWLPFVVNTKKVEDTIAFIRSVYETVAERRELIFTIYYDNQFAGLIGTRSTERNNSKTEIGYWLSEKSQKKGIAFLSCKRMLKILFEEENMNRIMIRVAVKNFKSQRIPEKLGFIKEGTEREGELLLSGYTDLFVYSLLKDEYINQEI